MKQIGLAALFVIGVAIFTNSPALAQEGEDWGTITLTNTADAKDRDYGASGQATLTDVTYGTIVQGEYPNEYAMGVAYGNLTVRCEGLTPGATYGVGPTGFSWLVHRGQLVGPFPAYSYVTASDTGTVELAVQVQFNSGCSYQWVEDPPMWPSGPSGHWELTGCSYYYPLEVFRRHGRNKVTPVLGGYWYFEP
jgi:hypothetical protein